MDDIDKNSKFNIQDLLRSLFAGCLTYPLNDFTLRILNHFSSLASTQVSALKHRLFFAQWTKFKSIGLLDHLLKMQNKMASKMQDF